MILEIKDLIHLLRSMVNVENEDYEDKAYIKMSDEDLTMYLKLGMTRLFPSVEDFSDLPSGAEYPLVLVSKKELYLKLAVTEAPMYNITADNNNQLQRSQKFDHYMKLAENAQSEFENWEDESGQIDPNTGIAGVQAYDAYMTNRHYRSRNIRLSPAPIVRVNVVNIYSDSVEIRWKSFNNDHFGKFLVYINEKPIVDMFKKGSKAEDNINEGAKEVYSTFDFEDRALRIPDLKPETVYYIAVFSIERNQKFGYKEVVITTLEEVTP